MKQEEYLKFHEMLCDHAWLDFVEQARDDISQFDGARMLEQRFDWLVEAVVDDGADGDGGIHLDARGLVATAVLLSQRWATQAEFKAFCAAGRSLSVRKNNDYARPQDHVEDPYAVFKNFLQCERLGICSVEAGFLVRLSDKVSRCCNLLGRSEGPSVVDEKLEDTLLDIVNYTCLLMAYIETKKIEGAKK